jgi:hypothetical protein
MKTGFLKVVSTMWVVIAITTIQLPVYAIRFINQRASIGSNDTIDWSSLGTVKPFNNVPNLFFGNSENGRGFKVSIPSFFGSPRPIVFETLSQPGIETNFSSGDYVLFTGLTDKPFPPGTNTSLITIKFDQPVQAAGTQLALGGTTKPYQAIVSAFDHEDNLLGTFSTEAISSQALDNSAVFLGAMSDTANISRLVFRTSETNVPFGINSVNFKSIPEPSSVLGLLTLSSLSFLLLKRK